MWMCMWMWICVCKSEQIQIKNYLEFQSITHHPRTHTNTHIYTQYTHIHTHTHKYTQYTHIQTQIHTNIHNRHTCTHKYTIHTLHTHTLSLCPTLSNVYGPRCGSHRCRPRRHWGSNPSSESTNSPKGACAGSTLSHWRACLYTKKRIWLPD